MDIRIDDIAMTPDILSPIGIMINEMISNSMKHAFKGMEDGLITVAVSKRDSLVTLVYGDNGIGLPDTVSLEKNSGGFGSGGFGLRLVDLLVDQIDGRIRTECNGGTKYIVEIPV